MIKSFYQYMKEKTEEYYTKQAYIGLDFFTSPELDRTFGYAIGELIFKLLKDYEKPTILELGGGNGTLAYDIFSFLETNYPSFFHRVKYLIYEFSPMLKEKQRERLFSFAQKVDWVDDIPEISGFIFSNEFFDCFPVRIIRDGKELYLENGREVWMPVQDERAMEYMSRLNMKEKQVAYEVCLDCVDFLKKLSERLKKGYIFTVDYGYLEQPPFGTVVGFKGHRMVKDIYSEDIFDITASVNFKALMEYGRDFGLEVVFFKNQRDFLLSSDTFRKELERLTQGKKMEDIERLSRMKTMLISMGERFKVLLQKKCIL